MNIFGIDKLNFYVPAYYLDLAVLAEAREISPEKFYLGLGQRFMAVPPPGEDMVTMAANAALPILQNEDLTKIELVIFATESGLDFSKAAATYIHRLFNLPKNCRVIELKEACYAATFGLQMALLWLKNNPGKKALLLASDVARYELGSAAESSQGAGAVAMLLSAAPRLLAIEEQSGFYTEEAMDFWRPNYRDTPLVDGKYSCEVYLKVLEECWLHYQAVSKRSFSEHAQFCYHVPVPKLVVKAHKRLKKINGIKELNDGLLEKELAPALDYNRVVGNCYTASLYLSVISLLENSTADLSGKRLGLYSYGSGCSGEFFSAIVQPGYQKMLYCLEHEALLKKRQALSYQQYLDFYNFKLPQDGSNYLIAGQYKLGACRLIGCNEHCLIYEQH